MYTVAEKSFTCWCCVCLWLVKADTEVGIGVIGERFKTLLYETDLYWLLGTPYWSNEMRGSHHARFGTNCWLAKLAGVQCRDVDVANLWSRAAVSSEVSETSGLAESEL